MALNAASTLAVGNDSFTWKCDAGTNPNRGVELDWLRMFWDLRTDGGVAADDIFEIMDKANPHTWNANGTGTGGSYPSARMSDAAFTVGGNSLRANNDAKAAFNGADR